MKGILGWLDKFFTSAADAPVKAYLAVAHWALRGITSLVWSLFGNNGKAWNYYYADSSYFTEQVTVFGDVTRTAHSYTLQVKIPSILRWAIGLFSRLDRWAAAIAAAVARDVASLRGEITAAFKSLTRWTLSHVYAPLAAIARQLRADLLKWGWTAWWWITHLDKLAAALILHLAVAMEANAWQLAGMLGRFALALIMRNARRIALLVESVVAAVI